MDKRGVLVSEQVVGKSIEPYTLSFDPEPGISTLAQGGSVLDVEGGLHTRAAGLVVTNDVVGGKGGNVQAHLLSKVAEVLGGEELWYT